jgi:hypothetical protein
MWTLYVEPCHKGFAGRLEDDGFTWHREAATVAELVEKFATYIVGCLPNEIRVVRC